MRKQQMMRYRDLLQAQLAELAQQGTATVRDMVEARGEELPDPNDRASRESELESALRLRDRDRKLIAKIQAALGRIETGTFGMCTSCGEPITAARLRARPVTELCIDCKTEAERRELRQ